jgi:site-specific recombinase XerD
MENFGKYLEFKRIVSKKQVPFYVAWVSQFFKFVDKKSTEEIPPKEVERFLKHLTKRETFVLSMHRNLPQIIDDV